MCLLFTSCIVTQNDTATVSVSEDGLAFHFLDVGQGDCTLIKTKDSAILIDAGTYESSNFIVKYLKSVGVEHLNSFIITHPHEDHMGGAAFLLEYITTDKVITNGYTDDAYFYEKFVDVVYEQDIAVEVANTDCIYDFGDFRLKFLSPRIDYEDTNNNSLVAMVTYGEVKALLTGDAEKKVEKNLIATSDIDADILKVGHHGSRNGSHDAFIKKVSPSLSVIHCGKDNSYGHPHAEAVKRLEKAGSQIFRTDELGTIILRTDGKNIYKDNEKLPDNEIISENVEYTYIGNKKSKVLHTDTCPNLPSEKNSIVFSSRQEAIDNGYKPCGNCEP